MVFYPQGQSGRDMRLTTRLRVSTGVTTLPICIHNMQRNKFTSYSHLSSFLYLSFLFYLYPGYCSFFAGIMAQDGNNHWTIRVSVFPCDSAYLILHKSSGIPRNFVWRGFNRFSCGQRTERMGIWGW
jgi:hypothetical protein